MKWLWAWEYRDKADNLGAGGGEKAMPMGPRVPPPTLAWPFPRQSGQWSTGQHRLCHEEGSCMGVGLEDVCKEGLRQRGSWEAQPGTACYSLCHGPLHHQHLPLAAERPSPTFPCSPRSQLSSQTRTIGRCQGSGWHPYSLPLLV